jgi:hypothetical protein
VDEKTRLTGAVHGMSGSPLYIDGKLVGALSRRLGGFEKDGHCGFTPIEDMLDVGKRKAADDDINPFPWPAGKARMSRLSGQGMSGYLALPLSISGWNERLRELLEPLFPSDGLLVPVAGGANGHAGGVEGAPIAPGAPLAVVLMSGDIDVAGTGTVTAVDGDAVLAFGHPLLGVGAVDFPFAQAEIISTLPSYQYPHKISNTGRLVGTLRQDRLSAVAGDLGKLPSLAAYEIELTHNGERRPSLRGRMVKDYRLAPSLVLMLAASALDGGQDYSFNSTLRMKGEIAFDGLPPVRLDGIYSGRGRARSQALIDVVMPVLELYAQFPRQLNLAKVKLSVQSYEKDSVWRVESVSVDRERVKPGGEVRIIARLKNDLGELAVKEFKVRLDRHLKDGEVTISVASGADLQRQKMYGAMWFDAQTPEQVIRALAPEFRNDALYMQVVTYGTGVNRPDQRQAELPPSVAQIDQGNPLTREQIGRVKKIWRQQEMALSGVVSGSVENRIKIE